MKIFNIFLFFFASMIFLGCQNEQKKMPAKIHWDRDMCDRCVMVLSDRKNTLQLQNPHTKKIHKFDDIGCLALWFKEENIDFKDSVSIWTTDAKTAEWIDARKAYYTSGNVTPMAYGYSAYANKADIKEGEEIFTYEEVIQKIK